MKLNLLQYLGENIEVSFSDYIDRYLVTSIDEYCFYKQNIFQKMLHI